jgi:hypothetical protein
MLIGEETQRQLVLMPQLPRNESYMKSPESNSDLREKAASDLPNFGKTFALFQDILIVS